MHYTGRGPLPDLHPEPPTVPPRPPSAPRAPRIAPAVLIGAAALAGGCATGSPTGPVYDPFEGANRQIYRFNDALDRAVLAPVARGYRRVTPDVVESGIANFFSNLDDVTVVANDLLQGKLVQAASDTGRVLVNTTVGLLGFVDVGSRIGLEKHQEGFGQTLGVWGIGEGPFIMVPLLGPNNGRSTVGIPVDSALSVPPYTVETAVQLGLTALDTVALRARLLAAGNLLNVASLDPYQTLRDFWVQRHRNMTFDGEVPVAIGLPDDDGQDALDDLDALDRLDELDELDKLDELDRLDERDELDELDELDRLDELEALDAANSGLSRPVREATDGPDDLDELDALDELDRLDALDAETDTDDGPD